MASDSSLRLDAEAAATDFETDLLNGMKPWAKISGAA
jgi:hypothetical protein